MKIAFLTSGGNAPCLNASIGRLLSNFSKIDIDVCVIGYLNGFSGLLKGRKIKLPIDFEVTITDNHKESQISNLYKIGGSVIGNSRVKLTNIDDCIKKKLIKEGQIPLEVAANQLINDKIDILFTIGGDDTNTTAKELQKYIQSKDIDITVIGIPKTIDNDIFPVKRSLGAYTAASQGANFFKNIVNENHMGESHLIVHEVMGRNSGWLTAFTALRYLENKENFHQYSFMKKFDSRRFDIHGIYVPEKKINLNIEIDRLSKVLESVKCLNLFICEGAFLSEISEDLDRRGTSIDRDAYGHIKLDTVNTAKWFSNKLSELMSFDRILVQKSGYYARSSAPNKEDLEYIFKICDFAFESALNLNSGVVGEDERTNELNCIDFDTIKGDKGLNINSKWFLELVDRIENC